jgi:Rrf2 family iron-sulfur cluster assembly transcriptional regulator
VAAKNGAVIQEGKMKFSTKSRYGTRLMLDMAQHYNQGPVQLGDIAKRQDISVKYLEQIIIPLKKEHYVRSVRGPKGGHILAKAPDEITVGEIVALLERGDSLTECSDNPRVCDRSETCPTRYVWKEAARAMFERLSAITLADLVAIGQADAASQGD